MGAANAKIALAMTAQIITVNPVGMDLSIGRYLKAQLKAIDNKTQSAVVFSFFATGTTIAINIPYIASPKAAVATAGKTLPAKAPKNVPDVYPKTGKLMSPSIYLLPTSPFCETETAKISSVLPQAINNLSLNLTLGENF